MVLHIAQTKAHGHNIELCVFEGKLHCIGKNKLQLWILLLANLEHALGEICRYDANTFREKSHRAGAGAGSDIESHTRLGREGHLGIEITELGEDFLRATMPVDERTKQPFGLLHGGSSVLLAETLASLAGWLCLDPELKQQSAGIEINANHLRAARDGVVTGTARPLHVGRSTQVWDIRIEDQQGRPVCVSRLTLAVVPRG